MKKLRRLLLWTVIALVALFCTMWVLGPQPESMGPYVQNVTATSAEVCCFDEVKCRVSVQLHGPKASQNATDPTAVRAHRLKFAGLTPDTRYDYRILDLDGRVQRYAGSFKTAPVDGARPFRFAVVGDSGDVPNWFKLHKFGFGRMRGALRHLERTGQWDVGQWMARQRPDFFFHLGDIIYSHNELPAYHEAFFRPFAAVLSTCALFNTLGNHDMHRWEHPEFFEVFHTPKALDPAAGYQDFSYTFVWGQVRFLVLDSFWQNWGPDSKMRDWLLATLRGNELPRVVVFVHSPPFTNEARVPDVPNDVRVNLWPILVQHKVDLVLSGDSHSYQRFKPVDGITLVIAGTGGKSIRAVAPTDKLAHHEERFGFLMVQVEGTKISGQFHVGADGPADEFVVVE